MGRAGQRAVFASVAIFLFAASGCGKSGSESHVERTAAPEQGCRDLPPLAPKASYTVGFVQMYEPTNPYTLANTADMVAEAAKRAYRLVYTPPAKADIADMTARTRALIAAHVDAIVMRPLAALGPMATEARNACIPVFTEGRMLDPAGAVPGHDYVTHIGTDSVIQGQLIADWLIKATHSRANIVELEGTAGASPTLGRKKGFDRQISTQPGMTIVASESGDFDRTTGHDVAKKLMAQYPAANVIYAHNDYMALGALDAVRELGKAPGKDVLIVSIDGLKEAVQDVVDGSIAAIEFNDPKLAAISLDTMEKYASGQPISAKITIRGPVIDHANAAEMMAEAF
jgi:galactofuranose transport system substrate-binding protein